jgi:hypothetical protein
MYCIFECAHMPTEHDAYGIPFRLLSVSHLRYTCELCRDNFSQTESEEMPAVAHHRSPTIVGYSRIIAIGLLVLSGGVL